MPSPQNTARLIAFVSFIVSVLLFVPAESSGMVHDFTGFFLNMREGTWAQALGSFDYNIVQPVLQCFNYALFQVAGRNGTVYFLVFHLIFGFGVFAWSRFLLEHTGSVSLTYTITTIFVLSPYVVEVLVYDVCQAYLLSFVLLGFYHFFLLRYLRTGGSMSLVVLTIVLLLQLWTFDLILIYLPLTVLFFYLERASFERQRWAKMLIINAAVVCVYFIENRFFLGSWIGHYGAEVHFDFNILEQGATMLKYFFKHILLGQFWSYPTRHSIYDAASLPIALILFILMSILVFVMYAMAKGRMKFRKLACYLFLAGLVSLLPVSNLSFADLMLTENDRYGFLFGFFILSSLVTVVFQIRSKFLKWALIAIFIIGQFFTQRVLINKWAEGQAIVDAGLGNWPAEFYDPDQEIYLLNLPDNYYGVYLFKNLTKESELFQETFTAQWVDTTFAQFHVVAQMNMESIADGASAEVLDSASIRLSLNQYGTWWWRNANGAYSYNTPDYTMELNGLNYKLTKKKRPLNCYIWDTGNWKKVQ